jgi:hypothetical protein
MLVASSASEASKVRCYSWQLLVSHFLHGFFLELFSPTADGAAGDSDLSTAVGRAGHVLGID